MRLLKTVDYRLFEAHDIPTPFPHYAILSHTWISPKDEITYQDVKTRKEDIENNIFKQKGWSKLKKYCDRAAKDGWEWAWMDTCCIDKTNPADTQEAINAMFRWYQDAGICYAYLEDVDALKILKDIDIAKDADLDEIAGSGNVAHPSSDAHAALNAVFTSAKWFSRGWTLQELLAPHYLVFVDQVWRRIGSRENWAAGIKQASRIEARHLTAFKPTDFRSCSIAMRLSWASRRETTLEEDETYALLGLFGISLPLIYGEGRWRAFNRLQRELITVYNDDSIFAWKVEQPTMSGRLYTPYESYNSGWGILASSSAQFSGASEIEAFGHYYSSFSMTNRGLEIKTMLWRLKNDPTMCLIRLSCGMKPRGNNKHPRTLQNGKMDELDHHDWEEELGTATILVRVNSSSDALASSSIFTLDNPAQVCIGGKYVVDFNTSMNHSRLHILDQDPQSIPVQGLKNDELFMEPNRIVFVNIELLNEGAKSELDVIINVAENGFPSIGILGREGGHWERRGNPLGPASRRYEALAEYLHFNIPLEPTYPMFAVDETLNCTVGVSLLPQPSHGRILTVPAEMAKLASLRKYQLKIKVRQEVPS